MINGQNKTKLAATLDEYQANPDLYLSIKDVPPALAVRLDYFHKVGIDGQEIVNAIRNAGPEKGPADPRWASVLMDYGNRSMEDGQEKSRAMDIEGVNQEYLKASFWYFFARFPHIFDHKGQEAYEKHVQAYKLALENSPYPIKEVGISFEAHTVKTYLRVPKTSSLPPLVILCGGTDVWKSDLEIHVQSEAFLKQGIATLVVDAPGTGECPVLDITQEKAYFLSILDAMKKLPQIDGSRIAFYGLSYGGSWAVKLALLAPELKATVNIGGPVHYSFEPDWAQNLPIPLKRVIGLMMGVDVMRDPHLFTEAFETRSVKHLLPAEQNVPLLCINGEDDEVVPIAEFDYLKENGIKIDSVIFSNDRHVASRNSTQRDSFTTEWVANKLGISIA